MPGLVFHLRSIGRLANAMNQDMAAPQFAQMVRNGRFAGMRGSECGSISRLIDRDWAMQADLLSSHSHPGGSDRLAATGGTAGGRMVMFGPAGQANLDGDRATGLHRAPWMAGIAQLVERQVVVLDVTGSSPVARPTILHE
jgi:hypothetical protein